MERMTQRVYCAPPCCWAPGLCGDGQWQDWAHGNACIQDSTDAPKLEFTPPLFRRRLSQVSRMAVQVIHDALERYGRTDAFIAFASLRGELSRQFDINRQVIEDGGILPAGFSLSVFNTPVALATIALGLHRGYCVLFPAQGFASCVMAAASPVLCGDTDEVLLVYADEAVPQCYGALSDGTMREPLAFATLLTASPLQGSACIQLKDVAATPQDFLRCLLGGRQVA